MVCFCTCAFTGCYTHISYDPKEDIRRPRYCEEHMRHMYNRTPEMNDDGLYIKVVKQ